MSQVESRAPAPPAEAPKPLTRAMRWTLYVASLLVLGVGLDLTIFAESTKTRFAWTIKPPLTAAFLGANYLAALVVVFAAARQSTWARARVTVPAILLFTSVTALLTSLNLEFFNLAQPTTWIWFAGYYGVPPLLAWVWWRQTKAPGAAAARESRLPAALRIALFFVGAALLLAGLALGLAPQRASPYWPWFLSPPDSGYARTGAATMETYVGVWLLAWATLLIHASIENDFRRTRFVFIALLTLGVLQAVAFFRFGVDDAHWDSPNVYIYLLTLALLAFTGIFGLVSAKRPVARSI